MEQPSDAGYNYEVSYPPSSLHYDYPMAPIEEFSTEDNQLLMSVLNSTPLQEQYVNYYPHEVPRNWEYQQQHTYSPEQEYRKNKLGHHGMDGHHSDHFRGQPGLGTGERQMKQPYDKMYHPPFPSFNVHNPIHQGNQIMPTNNKPHLNEGSSPTPHHFTPKTVIAPPKQQSFHNIVLNERSELQNNYSSGFKVHPIQIKEDPQKEFSNDETSLSNSNNQKNKRRESQNRASRNYRQRKKAYIKEIEAKLDQLKMENDQLRNENQKNRRVINQFRTLVDKPAPLLRSYSSELQCEDEEIDKLVDELNDLAQSQNTTDEQLKHLLKRFHEHMANRQQILQKEALQLVNPKIQERLVRIEGVPPVQVDQHVGQWLQEVSQFVSPEQIMRLSELKQRHYEAREAIWDERKRLNKEIKEFYQEKLASERLNGPRKVDQNAVLTLTNKLEELKKNLLREAELNNRSSEEFSMILTPQQEAIITIKHYSYYKDKVSAIQMLNNVWSVLSKEN